MTGDPWASLADVVSAAQQAEAAIHGAPPAQAWAAAAEQVAHARDYYRTAGYDSLADEADQVAQTLSSWAKSPPADPYAATWGPPAGRPGTLAHLWRRAARLTEPDLSWAVWGGLALSVVGVGLSVWSLVRRR
jgi:hypothetical protein